MKPILPEGTELCCDARVPNLRGVKVIMKIAQVAPLTESVPPRLYGGTERIVSYLTEELVRLGHDVTLFASGDSISSAVLAPCCTRALRLDPTMPDAIPHSMLMIDSLRERAEEFDVLHFHIDLFHFPLFHSLAGRTLPHSTVDRIWGTSGPSTLASAKCRWWLSRTTSAKHCQTPNS